MREENKGGKCGRRLRRVVCILVFFRFFMFSNLYIRDLFLSALWTSDETVGCEGRNEYTITKEQNFWN